MNFAISLTHIGVKRGDTIAICSENRIEFWGAVIGSACAGAIITTINHGYLDGELKHVMHISKPKYVILSPSTCKEHIKTIKSIPFIEKYILFGENKTGNVILYNDLAFSRNNGNGSVIVNGCLARNVNYEEFEVVDLNGPTDTLFILYSSGTTGLPKGVMLTHLNVITACCLPKSLSSEDMSMTFTPWFHSLGLVGSLVGISDGRTTVFLPKFGVELFMRTIEKYKVVQVLAVPPALVAVCKNTGQYNLSSVKVIRSGAAPLYKETEDLVKTKLPNIKSVMQGYGLTETTLGIIRDTHLQQSVSKLGSVGRVVPGTVIKIVDIDTRVPLGPNQRGELCAKGPLIMKGYVCKKRSDDFDEEGFFKTGDVGYYDEDRCFFIVDRLKELIKYKGFQVAPAELEALLIEHPAVRDAGVIGIPDKIAGEVPMAFVVKQAEKSVTEKEIQQFVAERLSDPKHLRGGVRIIDAIPKNPSGKILRKNLKKMLISEKSKL